MTRRIIDLSTEENKDEYIVEAAFDEEEIKLSYADGTKISVLHPTKEDIHFYRHQIENEIKEVLYDKLSVENKKILGSSLAILGSAIVSYLGTYFASSLPSDDLRKLLIAFLCLGELFLVTCVQCSRIEKKVFPVKDKLRAYVYFFTYQEEFEKNFALHIEDVDTLGLTHIKSLVGHIEQNKGKEGEDSSLKLKHLNEDS